MAKNRRRRSVEHSIICSTSLKSFEHPQRYLRQPLLDIYHQVAQSLRAAKSDATARLPRVPVIF